jgi:nickel-dependent lactate racemase
MQIGIAYGRDRATFEVVESHLVGVRREPPAPALADPGAAVRAALEAPLGFPALRRALTPDDHVTVVIDDHLPHFLDLVVPLLEHITGAGVKPEAITLLSATASAHTSWVDDLPDAFQDVTLEVHHPGERRHLAYLATTRHGRRLYLNRSLVDADQIVVLAGRGYDPWLGTTGAETTLFPALSDEATLKELTAEPTERSRAALDEETTEVGWLLGVPFLVQVIEGSGDTIADVVAGPVESSAETRNRLEARWRVTVERPADVVIASLSGDPSQHDFSDLARALNSAAAVVRSGGRIVLLTQANPNLSAAAVLQQAEGPEQAVTALRQQQPLNAPARWWADAARHAHIYLLSGLSAEDTEQLFATPLESAGQAQKLIGAGDFCVVLEDAHKTLAVLES